MSMIGPEGYRMDHEGDSWEELATERTRLNRSLRRFELHHEELLSCSAAKTMRTATSSTSTARWTCWPRPTASCSTSPTTTA